MSNIDNLRLILKQVYVAGPLKTNIYQTGTFLLNRYYQENPEISQEEQDQNYKILTKKIISLSLVDNFLDAYNLSQNVDKFSRDELYNIFLQHDMCISDLIDRIIVNEIKNFIPPKASLPLLNL